RIEVLEVDPLVRPVRGLLDVPRPEQDAWYPRTVDQKAGIAGCPPGGGVRRQAGGVHRHRHRADELVVGGDLEWDVVGAGLDVGFEPGQGALHARDRVLQLLYHLLFRLARIEAPVDLYLAPVGDHIRTCAAVHGADREARWTEDGMVVSGQLRAGRLELDHDSRRRRDRVMAEPWRCSVDRSSLDDYAVVEQTAIGEHELHRRRFREHRTVGLDAFRDQRAGARRILFLADHGRESHVAGGLLAPLAQRFDRAEHRGQATFHVTGAAAVEAAMIDGGAVRVPRPSLADRDGVDVAGEKQVRTAP